MNHGRATADAAGSGVAVMPKTIKASADIARTPEEVFAYVSDAARLPEWQPSVEAAATEPPGVVAVGLQGHEIRRVPGGRRTVRWEVTDCEPGRRWGVRGTDGPVRAHVAVELTPADDGKGTHVDYGIWFEGHGIGKVVRILVRQGARNDVPDSLTLLKKRLEEPSVPK
jgi:uncharacterized protein YndB with AHSA1/START domain